MTTYHITASIGTPSTTVDTKGAMDFDVTVAMDDGTTIDGAVTLIPSDWNGVLSTWGTRDHWLDGKLCKLARDLDSDCSDDGKDLCSLIAAACQTGEEQIIEIEESAS